MSTVQKLRDLPEWQQLRRALKEKGVDPNVIAEIGEREADSLGSVELIMAFEEALGITLNSK